MGIFSRRQKLDPGQFGMLCCYEALKLALDGDECLYSLLRMAGMRCANEVMAETEATIFAMFPIDVIIAGTYGPSGWQVRESFRCSFIDMTKGRMSPPDADRVNYDQWHEYLESRFSSYVETLRGKPESDGLRALAALAYKTICGEQARDPEVYMKSSVVLTGFYTMVGSSFPDVLKRVELTN